MWGAFKKIRLENVHILHFRSDQFWEEGWDVKNAKHMSSKSHFRRIRLFTQLYAVNDENSIIDFNFNYCENW